MIFSGKYLYSAPQPLTNDILIVHILVSWYTDSKPWLTLWANNAANSWLLKIFRLQPVKDKLNCFTKQIFLMITNYIWLIWNVSIGGRWQSIVATVFCRTVLIQRKFLNMIILMWSSWQSMIHHNTVFTLFQLAIDLMITFTKFTVDGSNMALTGNFPYLW